jgi:uncharacterized protein YjbI with pentapeptide repeats
MKVMKPQHAMIQTAPTQFGAAAWLGISVGYGFRLSDPRVLLHEAGVWQAFMSIPLSTRIMEAALPKQNAEWLLGGHASCVVGLQEIGKQTNWESAVSLDGVRKAVNCSAQVRGWSDPESHETRGLAVLAIDYPNAARDIQGRRNPVGTDGVAPLQLMGRVGPIGAPLAAMGPVDAQWQSRAELAPVRPAVMDPLGKDGTHMGWPDPMNLRYFQLAPEDQRSHAHEWAIGGAFELLNMGREGRNYRGTLPHLQVQLMVRRRAQQALEPVPLHQQTVWFLPDDDAAVVWWNGMAEIECVLSDEIDLVIVALRESEHLLSAERLSHLVSVRSSKELDNVSALRDSDLLPERSRGWTWDVILSEEDHPSIKKQPYNYRTLQARVDAFEASLAEMQRNGEKVRMLKSQADEEMPSKVKGAESLQASFAPTAADWRGKFTDAGGSALSDLLIDSADLSSLCMDEMRFERVRFQQVNLRQTIWRHCHFEDVQFCESDLHQARWENCSFVRCRFVHDELVDTKFSACELRYGNFDSCAVTGARFTDGQWEQMSLQSLEGSRLSIQRLSWDGASWMNCRLKDAHWSHVAAANSSVVECSMLALKLEHCTLEKFSVVKTDLGGSQWLECSGASVNFVDATKLDAAVMSDCRFEKTSWLDVSATRIKVQNCALVPLIAQGLAAAHSQWSHCVLSEADMMHADLSRSAIEATSLKDANLYGADLRMSKVTHSNLIRLQAGWVDDPGAFAGRGNLTARIQFIPRRHL